MAKENINKSLRDAALSASTKAYAPYSHFHIGAAVLMESGKIFSGCNIENASYGATICAERVATLKAISESETKIKKIYVYSNDGWPPCGLCRQVICEFASDDLVVIIGDKEGNEKNIPFKDLFPAGFTPDKLK